MGVEVRSHKGPEKPVMEFPVELVDITKLVPHEQTIEHELRWFINSVKESEELIWPLLIGKRNYTILDGHHRAKGLSRLDYTHVPAILIDYHDDDLIQLDTWYPKIKKPVDTVVEQLRELELDIQKIDPSSYSREVLDDREITAFIGNREKMYRVIGDREIIFKELRDSWIDNIIYYDDADMCVEKAGSTYTAVISWAYTKEEILEDVKNNVVHLPKTTRHSLKYRVPRCNYPLKELKREG